MKSHLAAQVFNPGFDVSQAGAVLFPASRMSNDYSPTLDILKCDFEI